MSQVVALGGAKVYLSTTTAADTVDTTSEFAALTYTQIKRMTTLGQYGDTRSITPVEILDEDRVRQILGAATGGTLSLNGARYDADPGQALMNTAFNGNSQYALKIEYDDKLTTSGVNSIDYLLVRVSGRQFPGGGANALKAVNYSLVVNSAPVSSAAS